MRKKNTLAIISAVLMIFVWTGAALAANTATMNVTSEPIRYHAVSDKGGGFTITFDEDTVLVAGDVITADLDLGVTIAAGRTIDLEISAGGSGAPFAAVPATASPFSYTGAVPVVTGGGIYFRVYGVAGTQRITISVLGAPGASITAGSISGVDQLILKFLNQGTIIGGEYAPTSALFMQGATPGLYDVPATLSANTLCINVSQYDQNTVHANMDSADANTGADKFTFVPSNPQIAHVLAAVDIDFEACFKGGTPGRMSIGSAGVVQGAGDFCPGFDNEDGAGYCAGQGPVGNTMVIAASTPFDQAQYTVEMEILVNGLTGDNGVYFSDELLMQGAYDTSTDACAMTGMMAHTASYYTAVGAPATPEASSALCTVARAGRAVRLVTAASSLGIGTTQDYLAFDLPWFNYQLDMIAEGDVVTIMVTLTKVPCGTVFSGEFNIGTFGCPTTPVTPTSCIYFPYFTEIGADADAYWDGIVITNMASTDATVTITVYEADGDVGTATVTVNSMSQYVNLLSNITFATSGTLGDSSCYVQASASGSSNIDGFGMMARQDTGESMGYLPRCCTGFCSSP
jgi:hypothetical protein